MIEDVPLMSDDVDVMVNNLMADSFTGYVRLALDHAESYVFYNQGNPIRSVEQGRGGESPKVMRSDKVFQNVRNQGQVPTSSYVLSPRLVQVISSFFAFKPLYRDYQVKRKELKKVLTNLEHDEFSGILQFDTQDGRVSILLDRGEPVHDQFARNYGQIICGREDITGLFEHVHANGSTIQVYAEKANEIENKKRKVDEDLERMKDLVVKPATGFMAAKDALKLDEDFVREWGFDPKSGFLVNIETSTGQRFENVKAQAARKKGTHCEVGQNLLKQFGLRENDIIFVSPAGD